MGGPLDGSVVVLDEGQTRYVAQQRGPVDPTTDAVSTVEVVYEARSATDGGQVVNSLGLLVMDLQGSP